MFDRLYSKVRGARVRREADSLYLLVLKSETASLLIPLLLDLGVLLGFLYITLFLEKRLFGPSPFCFLHELDSAEFLRLSCSGGQGDRVSLVVFLIGLYLGNVSTLLLSKRKRFLRSGMIVVALEVLYVNTVYGSKLPFARKVIGGIVLFFLCYIAYRHTVLIANRWKNRTRVESKE